MKYGLLIALGFAAATVCGCASQARVDEVGTRAGNQSSTEGRLASHYYYDFQTPKVEVIFKSNPKGALVELYNRDGGWVTVGSTPSEDVVIEATGKPELFRISQNGYIPQIRWVATLPTVKSINIGVTLEKDLEPNRLVLGSSR